MSLKSTLAATLALLGASGSLSAASVERWFFTMDPAAVVFGSVAYPQQVVEHQPGTSSIALAHELTEPGVQVDAFSRVDADTFYFSVDTHFDFGGQVVSPADVLLFDAGDRSVFFDASAEGLPETADVDAIAFEDSGDLVFSTDTTWSDGSNVFEDADVVRINSTGFAHKMDATAAGFDQRVDVDAITLLPNNRMVLSFTGGGGASGQPFGHGTLIRLTPTGDSKATIFDAASDLSSESDIIALGAVPAADQLFSDRFES